MELVPEQLESGYLGNPETWLSNLLIENNFSAFNQGGRKPDAMFLFERVHFDRHVHVMTMVDLLCYGILTDLGRRAHAQLYPNLMRY